MIFCPECTFWIPHKNIPDYGECRKNAPTAIVKSNAGMLVPSDHAATWPFTRSIDGCFGGKKGSVQAQPIDHNDTPELSMTTPNSVFSKAVKLTKKTTSNFDREVSKALSQLKK